LIAVSAGDVGDIAKRRSEFTIFVVDGDILNGKSTVDDLKLAGFEDCRFYPTLDSALAMARENPPHVLVLEHAAFGEKAEEFLGLVRALSSEILTILILPSALKLQGFLLVANGLVYDTVSRPLASGLELIQKVDRAIGRLYYQFESEQLREHYSALQNAEPPPPIPVPVSQAAAPAPLLPAEPQVLPSGYVILNQTLGLLSAEKDVEETIWIFMEALTRSLIDAPVLYFKYFPGHMTLLFSRATLLPGEKFRGIGVDLKKEDVSRLPRYVDHPAEIPGLRNLVRHVFGRENYVALSHTDGAELCGVFVILTDATIELNDGLILSLRRIFDLSYKRNLLFKERHNLDTFDQVTGLFSRRQFSKHLADEISRSRRLTMPVSLIVFDIDGVSRLNERYGIQQINAVLKSVGGLMRKTSRTNDIVGRVGPDEFAFLLPHTPLKGAAVKAERFRRIIEAAKFPLLEGQGPLTVSVGVSEYPNYCGDADGLIDSARSALDEVRRLGGNKVCVAPVPPNFERDFEPLPVPSTNKTRGGGT
jgi:diguanylate cyclase (GGDEF)-like protein